LTVSYDIADITPHAAEQSSPDAATARTFTAPRGARAALISVVTTPARVTLDGSTPSASNGLVLPVGVHEIPVGRTIKITSTATAACLVNVLWLT
jgi:hypothetical protein